jgi:PncC family amidohydrolase
MHLEQALHEWMIAHKKTLAIAESCTGGAIASRLTSLAGASNYFLGSLVVYSDLLKKKVLGVSEKTLNAYGSVSKETCLEMVEGILKVSDADYGLAITGVAGPQASGSQEIGTIWIGLCKKKGAPVISQLSLKGNRREIIEQSANESLSLLLNYLILES